MVMQGRKIYLSMLQNQRNTCLVRRTTYPRLSYHFVGGRLQAIYQVRLGPVLPRHVCIIPYREAGNVRTTATCPSLKENTSRPIVIV